MTWSAPAVAVNPRSATAAQNVAQTSRQAEVRTVLVASINTVPTIAIWQEKTQKTLTGVWETEEIGTSLVSRAHGIKVGLSNSHRSVVRASSSGVNAASQTHECPRTQRRAHQ